MECFNHVGVFVDSNDNFLLADVLEDSLIFVTMIVEIEQEFQIEIPDEYLAVDRIASYRDLELLVSKLINSK